MSIKNDARKVEMALERDADAEDRADAEYNAKCEAEGVYRRYMEEHVPQAIQDAANRAASHAYDLEYAKVLARRRAYRGLK
jgi:hypothetical protein